MNAGFQEFGIHGKKRAALNRILEAASVPKGVFYHYCKGKDDLYQYLIQFGIHAITEKLMDSTILEEPDYIKRMVKSYMIKVDAYKEYRYFERFLMRVYQENNAQFIDQIDIKESKEYGQRIITENIDFSKFRVNDTEANIRVVSRYLQQSFNDIINTIQTMTKTEILTYLETEAKYIKKVVYKEEYHD